MPRPRRPPPRALRFDAARRQLGLPQPGPTAEKPHAAQVAISITTSSSSTPRFSRSETVRRSNTRVFRCRVAGGRHHRPLLRPAAPSGPRADLRCPGTPSQSDRGHVLNAVTPEPLKFTSKGRTADAPKAPVSDDQLYAPRVALRLDAPVDRRRLRRDSRCRTARADCRRLRLPGRAGSDGTTAAERLAGRH